jgi:hypothetical protein
MRKRAAILGHRGTVAFLMAAATALMAAWNTASTESPAMSIKRPWLADSPPDARVGVKRRHGGPLVRRHQARIPRYVGNNNRRQSLSEISSVHLRQCVAKQLRREMVAPK